MFEEKKSFASKVDNNYEGIPQQGESSYYPREVPYNNTVDNEWTEHKKNIYCLSL